MKLGRSVEIMLAFAQNFKNKDIPEDGFKVVILINCDDLPNERFVSNQKKLLQQIQSIMKDHQQQRP